MLEVYSWMSLIPAKPVLTSPCCNLAVMKLINSRQCTGHLALLVLIIKLPLL